MVDCAPGATLRSTPLPGGLSQMLHANAVLLYRQREQLFGEIVVRECRSKFLTCSMLERTVSPRAGGSLITMAGRVAIQKKSEKGIGNEEVWIEDNRKTRGEVAGEKILNSRLPEKPGSFILRGRNRLS